jgi:hypothetical protein
MADGSLAEAAFRHYLVQDYLFLIEFARAYALSVYKSPKLNFFALGEQIPPRSPLSRAIEWEAIWPEARAFAGWSEVQVRWGKTPTI